MTKKDDFVRRPERISSTNIIELNNNIYWLNSDQCMQFASYHLNTDKMIQAKSNFKAKKTDQSPPSHTQKQQRQRH